MSDEKQKSPHVRDTVASQDAAVEQVRYSHDQILRRVHRQQAARRIEVLGNLLATEFRELGLGREIEIAIGNLETALMWAEKFVRSQQ